MPSPKKEDSQSVGKDWGSVELGDVSNGERRARFQVNLVEGGKDENGEDETDRLCEDEEDDDNLDHGYVKSFRHMTREALPRLDNYRNIMSIQAAYRPTLDELHNATIPGKVSYILVFLRCLLMLNRLAFISWQRSLFDSLGCSLK